jgi:hypothetical protein
MSVWPTVHIMENGQSRTVCGRPHVLVCRLRGGAYMRLHLGLCSLVLCRGQSFPELGCRGGVLCHLLLQLIAPSLCASQPPPQLLERPHLPCGVRPIISSQAAAAILRGIINRRRRKVGAAPVFWGSLCANALCQHCGPAALTVRRFSPRRAASSPRSVVTSASSCRDCCSRPIAAVRSSTCAPASERFSAAVAQWRRSGRLGDHTHELAVLRERSLVRLDQPRLRRLISVQTPPPPGTTHI